MLGERRISARLAHVAYRRWSGTSGGKQLASLPALLRQCERLPGNRQRDRTWRSAVPFEEEPNGAIAGSCGSLGNAHPRDGTRRRPRAPHVCADPNLNIVGAATGIVVA